MWTQEEYRKRAALSWEQYMAQDSWGFNGGVHDNNEQEILGGLKMYNSVGQCGLPMLLLGDAKIRADGSLVENFGFASGSGSEDQEFVDKLNTKRKEIASKTNAPAIPVSAGGSILSDKKWTPLVNDSFILGGTHRGMEFHLALQDFDQFSQSDKGLQGKDKWKAYLKAKPDVLWNRSLQCPRVFARELIGLKTFGYTPHFTNWDLAFGRNSGDGTADFTQYLNALRKAGFPGKVEANVVSAISEFLFGDAKALN
jgi:hypothetical protein